MAAPSGAGPGGAGRGDPTRPPPKWTVTRPLHDCYTTASQMDRTPRTHIAH